MKNIITGLFNPENSFFQIAKESKRLTHISLSSLILPVIFLTIAGVLTQFVFVPLFLSDPKQVANWVHQAFRLYVMFGLGAIIIFLWVRFFESRSIRTLGFTKSDFLKKYFSGFLMGILMNTIVVALIALLGNIEVATQSTNLTGINSIGIVLIFLFGFIIQGASEEILSRGWMMQVIGTRYWPWLGVLISTILFSLLHLGNTGINPISVINLLLFALLMVLYVMKDESLWSACGWHSAWNWMLGNVYGLSVSGSGEKKSIFDLNTTGNELTSGGSFGPEGSLITTFVLFVFIIFYGIKIVKKSGK